MIDANITEGDEMRHFDYTSLVNRTWDNEVINYLALIHEYKGRQTAYMQQNPSEPERLVEIAKALSTEASNSIEGIRTTETRLRQLMNDKATPRNRAEKEIAGYRDALDIIHDNFDYIPLTPNHILQLHKVLLSHTDSGFGGTFKNVQNYISATDETGRPFTLFTPPAPHETAEAMQEICDEYNRAIGAAEGTIWTATEECHVCSQHFSSTVQASRLVSIFHLKPGLPGTKMRIIHRWKIRRLAGTSRKMIPHR